jgi:hypothetical protein
VMLIGIGRWWGFKVGVVVKNCGGGGGHWGLWLQS